MKKYIKYIYIALIAGILIFGIYEMDKINIINISKENLQCDVITKGVKGGCAIEVDKEGNLYIAKKEAIKKISKEGKESEIIKNPVYDIEDILYYNEKIYFITGENLLSLNLENLEVEKLLDSIPLGGNGIKRKIFIRNGEMFFTVPSRTNSGIAEAAECDIPSVYSVLSGNNYGTNQTGFYKAYGTDSKKGEIINAKPIGNSAIYRLEGKSAILFASGIRGITGIDTDKEGNIFAIFSGMKNEGLRPVNRDKDYVYKVIEGNFYGWPDYSGGDYIESPRFSGKEKVKPLLDSYLAKNIQGSIFQSNEVDTLKEMAIDKNGTVFSENTMIYFDRDSNAIKSYREGFGETILIKLSNKSYVEDIIYKDDEFLILDSTNGFIFKIKKPSNSEGFNLPYYILTFVFIVSVISIGIVIKKITFKRKDS